MQVAARPAGAAGPGPAPGRGSGVSAALEARRGAPRSRGGAFAVAPHPPKPPPMFPSSSRSGVCPALGWGSGVSLGTRHVGSPGPRRRLTLLPLLPSAEMETNNHFNFTGLSSAPAASGPKPTPASGDSPFAHGSPLGFPPQGKSKCPRGAGTAHPGAAGTRGTAAGGSSPHTGLWPRVCRVPAVASAQKSGRGGTGCLRGFGRSGDAAQPCQALG